MCEWVCCACVGRYSRWQYWDKLVFYWKNQLGLTSYARTFSLYTLHYVNNKYIYIMYCSMVSPSSMLLFILLITLLCISLFMFCSVNQSCHTLYTVMTDFIVVVGLCWTVLHWFQSTRSIWHYIIYMRIVIYNNMILLRYILGFLSAINIPRWDVFLYRVASVCQLA